MRANSAWEKIERPHFFFKCNLAKFWMKEGENKLRASSSLSMLNFWFLFSISPKKEGRAEDGSQENENVTANLAVNCNFLDRVFFCMASSSLPERKHTFRVYYERNTVYEGYWKPAWLDYIFLNRNQPTCGYPTWLNGPKSINNEAGVTCKNDPMVFNPNWNVFFLLSIMQLQRERNGEAELRGAEGDDGETRRPANSSRAERHDQGKQWFFLPWVCPFLPQNAPIELKSRALFQEAITDSEQVHMSNFGLSRIAHVIAEFWVNYGQFTVILPIEIDCSVLLVNCHPVWICALVF